MFGRYQYGQAFYGRSPLVEALTYLASYVYVAVVPAESRRAVVRYELREASVAAESRQIPVRS